MSYLQNTLVAIGAAVFLSAGAAAAAELSGAVYDASGLAVAGAKVEAREAGTGAAWRTATAASGQFHFFALPPGQYELAVSHPGFATLRRTGVAVGMGSRVSLDLELQVGDIALTVVVDGAAPLLQTTVAAKSLTVDRDKAGLLPLDGRNFVPLIALSAGVALPPGSASSPSLLPRISGSRPRTSEYLYDGAAVLQPEPGQVAYYPVLDAIDEFRVELNSYPAEFGRSNGGIIQVSTRAGGNKFHGSLWEFLRHEKLNARNLFAPVTGKPLFRRNQYGFVLGGPVQRNRTFFFADWQGTRLRNGNSRISNVPTLAQRAGSFAAPAYDPATPGRTPFPGNAIPASRMDPVAARLLDRYPLPTSAGASNNYRRVATDWTDQDQLDTRLDRYFGARHRVFGRYPWLRDESAPGAPLPDGSGAIGSGVIGDTVTRADSVVGEHTWTLSPRSVNQARFGYSRRGFERRQLLGVTLASAATGIPNLPAGVFAGALPIFQIAGYQQLGPSENANSQFTTSMTQWTDSFSTVRRGHSLKAGMDIRHERLDVLQPPDPTGLFSFTAVPTAALTPAGAAAAGTGNALASFLLGQVSAFNVDVQQDVLRPRATIAEGFVQDDWKVSRRLALSLGVRYTLNFPSTEANDRGAVFNLGTGKLDFLGRNGVSRTARRLHTHDFGPRAGVAFQTSRSMVLRAGYGLVWIEQSGITTPFTVPFFPFIQSVGQRAQDNLTPAFVLARGPSVRITEPNPDSGSGQGVFAVDRNTGSGYAQQWNLTLQRTFRRNWSAELGYLGSKLTHLGVPDTNLNQLSVTELALGSKLTELVPNPGYGTIPPQSSIGGALVTRQQLLRPYPGFTTVTLFRNNIGNSTYHALAAQVEKRFSAGLTWTAAYTFSKLIDDASSVFDAAILTGPVANFPVADSANRRLEKDLSTGDIPHVFSSGFVYELPLGHGRLREGWRIAGLVRLQAGMPLAVTQITNFNAFAGYGTQRPNRIAEAGLPAGERTLARWFNTAAFTAAPQFTLGNSPRNPVRGPGYQDADLMVGKITPISERWKLEIRAEAFNVSNTPPLGQPNGVAGNPAFGAITSAFDPRVFEVAAKIHF